MAPVPPKKVVFGRGINAAVRARQVSPMECEDGANFDLALDFTGFRPRKPFDLVATAPNGAEIRGYAQLVKRDGTISTLIQAGSSVYEWDGASTFTIVGSVSSGARLRGKLSHNWSLGDLVIITDLEKVEPVRVWDGSTFSVMAHNLSSTLYAKYALVENERLYLANVQSGTDTPHVLLVSKIQDYGNLSQSVRSDGIGSLASTTSDAFFLPVRDLKPINGLETIFRTVVLSTELGRLYNLVGQNAFDFEMKEFYPGSHASGDEAMVNVGNDIAYGHISSIESLSGTQNFGDVATNDISRWIAPEVEDVLTWTLAYDPRLRKIYCLPAGGNVLWVCHKSILDSQDGQSPWSKWTTDNAFSFQPSVMMNMLRPSDGIEVVFMGGAQGQIYQLDGSGTGDAGSTDIACYRTTGIIDPADGQNLLVFDNKGYVDFKRVASATLNLDFINQGLAVFTRRTTVNIPATTEYSVYGGTSYYDGTGDPGDDNAYYGDALRERISRQTFTVAGIPSFFQLRSSISGTSDFEIDEIGLDFSAAKQA